MTIADLITQSPPDGVAPPALADGGEFAPTFAGKLLGTIGTAIDMLLEKADQGTKARFPTLCDPTALPYIGFDRRIARGSSEGDTSYRTRLQKAFPSWGRAGSPWGVLASVLPYFLPLTPSARTVNDLSVWDSYDAGADTDMPPAHVHVTWQTSWNWDNEADPHPSAPLSLPAWWRFWLILFSVSPNAWCGPAPLVGSGPPVGQGTAVGLNVSADYVQGIRDIAKTWVKAGRWCRWIVISFDAGLFDPAVTADATHNPAGTFGPLCAPVGGVYVPTRFANARYVDGVF